MPVKDKASKLNTVISKTIFFKRSPWLVQMNFVHIKILLADRNLMNSEKGKI
jgi:hypothetical protein